MRPKGEEDPDAPGTLNSASPWARILFFLSGSTMNFIVGIVLYAVIFFNIGEPVPGQILIDQVAPNSPAAEAQLQEGDYITAVNGEKLKDIYELKALVDANRGNEIEITVLRQEDFYTVSLIPRVDPLPPKVP